MEAIERNMMIWFQLATISWNGPSTTRSRSAIAAILGAAEKNAVTGVGAPS